MKTSFLILAALTCAMMSCQKTIDDISTDNDRLVVEGWIDSDGNPYVILSRSFSPNQSAATSLSDLVVRWAEVTISDGETTELMIGLADRSIMPPFIYTTANMTGQPGRTYTISASYGNQKISAECTMPHPALINRIETRPVAGSDTLREIRVSFTPKPDAYYQLCIYSPEISGRSLPCFLGTYHSPADIDSEVTLTACRPKADIKNSDRNYTTYFVTGNRLEVILTTVTPEVWHFWREYDDVVAFGGNIFLATAVAAEGNIRGGRGIWSARGTDSRIITLE